MSMITMTGPRGSAGHAADTREPGFFDRLMAAIRISAVLRQNGQPRVSDLETLGIADAFQNYLNERRRANQS